MISYFNKFIFFSLTFFIFAFFSNQAIADGHANYEFTPEKPYYVIEDPNAEGSENKQSIKLLITDIEFFIKTVMYVTVRLQEEVPLHLIF